MAEPIPMLLVCPACGKRHIDEGPFATREHHTHACQHCGMVWRPALVPTVGVRFLPGFKNEGPAPKDTSSVTLKARVESALRFGGPMTALRLVEYIDDAHVNLDSVRTTLSKLRAEGRLMRVRHGTYEVATDVQGDPEG